MSGFLKTPDLLLKLNFKYYYFPQYKQKKVMVCENFQLPVFDGFTRFKML